jgi:hypothetical protein
VLTANMETALNAVWDAEPKRATASRSSAPAWCARASCAGGLFPTIEVTLVDINPSRAEIARALRLNFATPDMAPTGATSSRERNRRRPRDRAQFARDEAIVLG